ncbi:large-conductance mechanosensitive channel [Obelidium mucronatum]|nr:large-conductance mechanosensitive channel [Obelidium mucronatum]
MSFPNSANRETVKTADLTEGESSEQLFRSNDTIVGHQVKLNDGNNEDVSNRNSKWWSRSKQNSKDIETGTMEKEWKHRTVARRAGESVKSSVKRTTKSIKHISKEFGLFMGDGRILQYAIGMVIGTAFTTVINSLVSDLLSPFIGLAIGTQFENFYVVLKKPSDEICNKNATLCNFHTPADARAVGAVTWNLGSFFQTMLNFLIIAFSLFSVIRFFKTFITSTKQQLKNIKTGLKNSNASLNALPLFKKRDPSTRPGTGSDGTLFKSRSSTPGLAPSPIQTPSIMKGERRSETYLTVSHPPTDRLRRSASDSGFLNLPNQFPLFGVQTHLVSSHNQMQAVAVKTETHSSDASGSPEFQPRHKNLAEYFGKDPNQSFHDLKECSYCLSHIPARASRCAHCTAAVEISVEYLDFDHRGKEGGKGKNVQFDMNFSSIPFRI